MWRATTQAKAIFEAFPRVRILFENGGGADPGAPEPRFESDFPSWPIPDTDATAWYFGADGTLVPDPPTTRGANSYRYDPSHAHDTTLDASAGQSGPWVKLPQWSWVAPKSGTALAYETAPLAADVTAIGNASVDLWLQSTAPDTDLQVTLTEVRPDGQEVYVQNGWLRASNRALGGDATELRPTHPLTEAAVQTLPSGEYSEARGRGVPVRARVPHGLAYPRDHRRAGRLAAVVELRGASRRWATRRTRSAGAARPVAHRAAGRGGCEGRGRPALVSRTARPALPAGRRDRRTTIPLVKFHDDRPIRDLQSHQM